MAETNDAFQFFQEEAKVVIATHQEQTLEQAPSIVSVVTRHDIESYGARDLADILRQVPDFDSAWMCSAWWGLPFAASGSLKPKSS